MQNIDDLLSPRGGSNFWAQRQDILSAWRAGNQTAVFPVTTEFACILDCNARCPFCPYHKAQLNKCESVVPLGDLALVNGTTSASLDVARIVVDRSRAAGVSGMLFTGGGEPLIWSPLFDALQYSHSMGMHNALYTNGFAFGYDPTMAARVMQSHNGLVFVRISVNAISPDAVKKHWGLPNPKAIEHQFAGLVRLLEARNQLADNSGGSHIPSIQISTIVDKHTVGDLELICDTVAAIFQRSRSVRGNEDVMVVRPLTIHGRKKYSSHDHEAAVIHHIIDVCGPGGTGHQRLAEASVSLFLGFGLNKVASGEVELYDELIEQEYQSRDISLANGIFLTVDPRGTVYLSTEHNCGPEAYAIGNLVEQSVVEIYGSERRSKLLAEMNRERWGPNVAQPTARTARLDRIARAIHRNEVRDEDLKLIRLHSLKSHSLLLD